MTIRKTRIFNADVGDRSVSNAGPDALEQDIDNLYLNKPWNDEVLSKTNLIVYTPTTTYNPATKEYVDLKSANVFINNNNISVLQTDVISADTAQLVNAWIKNLFVEVLTTNFEDYLTGTRIDNAFLIGNTKLERNYMKSVKEGIRLYQQALSLTPKDFIIINGADSQQIYYTSVRGAYAYKFFTIQNPVALAGNWTPKIKYNNFKIIKGENGLHYYTDITYSVNGYEFWTDALPHLILTNVSEHMVKVKTIVNEYEKASLEFKEVELTPGVFTKQVLLTMGSGDGVVPNESAIVKILKHNTGLGITYKSSNTALERTINVDDTGIHGVIQGYQAGGNMRNIVITGLTPDISMGNVNDVIFKI